MAPKRAGKPWNKERPANRFSMSGQAATHPPCPCSSRSFPTSPAGGLGEASEYILKENKVFQRCPFQQRALTETETLSLFLKGRGKTIKVVFNRHVSGSEFLSAFRLSCWGPPCKNEASGL